MPYIIIVVMVFAVAFVVAVMASVEVYLETQRSKYIPKRETSFTFEWLENISLDGFPVPADYETNYPTEIYKMSAEETEESSQSMFNSRWNRAWEDDKYELELSLKLRKPHPARPSKARK